MKNLKGLLLLPVFLMLQIVAVQANDLDSVKYLQPRSEHLKEAKLVVSILDYYHYRETDLNDSLSSVILDNYLDALDGNKNYFLASDIKSFQKYRFEFDNDLKAGNLVPAFYMFNIYQKRVTERLAFAIANSSKEFDFDKKETYRYDRTEEPYAQNEAELDELWRKVLKSQALSLKLSGSDQEKVTKTLIDRYNRFETNVNRYNSNDVFELFMNSVTEAFDPHTSYFTPLNAQDFRRESSKSMEGIGATLQQDNDFTKIVELRPGGPAFLSGQIDKDDKVIGIAQGAEGEMIDVVGWRSDEVAGKIRGSKGTLVRLELLPAGSSPGAPTKIVNLVRDKIKYDEARAKSEVIQYTENNETLNLGVIKLPDFYLDGEELSSGKEDYLSATNDVKRLITEMQADGIDGIMIDLRNNGGGALFEAINLSGLFIPGGPVVQVKYKNGRIEKGTDDDKTMFYEGPMSVMINRFSASASEIFAGAMQDYKRGVIVGEQTYGKGTVQNVRGINDFLNDEKDTLGLIKYTIAKFYRVNGSSTQHMGVSPDVALPSAFDAKEFGESSRPSALKWDQIASAKYTPLNYVDSQMLDFLKGSNDERLKTDQSLVDLQSDIADLKTARSKLVVSLNYDIRKVERDNAEKKRAARVKVGASLNELDANKVVDRSLDDLKDPYLKESIILLAEQIAFAKKKG